MKVVIIFVVVNILQRQWYRWRNIFLDKFSCSYFIFLLRVGGRVYIDTKAFEQWLDSQGVDVLAVPTEGE